MGSGRYLFQQPASDTDVRNGSMTYLWSNLTFIFSHASFPLKYLHFPSALLIWSKSLDWVFLLGWVNYMKEHNIFDPVSKINTNPCLRHNCQQAALPLPAHSIGVTPCWQKTSKESSTYQRLGSISEPTSPTHTAQDVHCEGIPQVGLLTGQCIHGHYANGMWNILLFLQFSCNYNQIP